MRKNFCPACSAAKHGKRTRVAYECTCVPAPVGYYLPGGGHASFPQAPDAETLAAVAAMVDLAKKMKIK